MSDEIKAINDFDRLIHEPARLAIMAVLFACDSADFKFIQNSTGITKGNLSAHLRKLEAGEYLKINKGFKGNYPHTTCALTRTGRKAFARYRKQYLALAKQFTEEG
ncbi:MAG: transcriptional regulator [Chloroflexi bacterium]|nr:MAG: transcriptional regulator [Chloroflexota bacterium]MBL1195648.1 transcriptional regulator [Chloroflexota bacterium]NOH12936.1 transcriptional regulator [Chloroflexota bacterium]